MSDITVTAHEGQTVRVTLQQLETIKREIPEMRDGAGALLAAATTQEFKSWVDKNAWIYATEARQFEVGKGQRLMVEGIELL